MSERYEFDVLVSVVADSREAAEDEILDAGFYGDISICLYDDPTFNIKVSRKNEYPPYRKPT